ncbi:hypothetical protein FNF29_07497 [Cafeteria roenbergensis]|uniref:Borealin N-terminal domain-containing protein n=1 Tax=Cafeteria roenbergensis TaxID=33653 RepID=A0A5A8C2F3_CAFRO|nr:hypothetical protein FNF29_07497 [Cafeteria roenbergensis]|eukprot:KAA0147236.1 hypothetical protein FNF29_07497 [Cafeteria roenbergensis]
MASRSKRRPAQGDGVRPVSEDPARSELVCKLSELNVEVDRRCDKVVADSEAAASELRSAFSMQMAKLPKRIRAMTMREFIEQCGGNVMQATPGGARLARPDEVFVSANGSPVMLAPAAGPGTVIRATIGKSRTAVPRIRPHVAKGGADAPPPATSAVQPETEEGGVIIDLATADGRALDLSKPDVAATLSGADKEAALARLLALQSQVASVLSKLNA